ncbi:uncharacterized protein LOC134264096 [Saccostrea cucullata]|uniref:uncharacterized protein LOC134264096 n=1 Tax=Saccostrea cuccullata TaxID=36930 RepID=UPI002ED03AFB
MEKNKEQPEDDRNTYVDLVLESHDANTQQTSCQVEHTQSQKKRRRFIPLRFHSKIFKASKKKRHVDDHRISTNSSSYASCKTYKKDSAKSNVSSHTYLDIDQCIHHIELERCNSIATESCFSERTDGKRLDTSEQGIQKANNVPKILYQMELPKKTGRHAKKYMVLFCMILVCAILSAAIASVFSTRSLSESLPSAVDKQLSDGSFLQRVMSNVSNVDVMNRIGGLQNDMEDFSNRTKMSIDLFSLSFPNKTDFDVLKVETHRQFYKLIHAVRCKTDCTYEGDGNYQSCYTCEGFITCTNHILKNMTCAPTHEYGKVYWDDYEKRCLFGSDTCNPLHTFFEEEKNYTESNKTNF